MLKNPPTTARVVGAADRGLGDAASQAVIAQRALSTHYFTRRVGADYSSGGTSTNSTLLLLSPRRLSPGRVKTVRVWVSGTGDFAVVLVRPNGDGTFTVVESAPLTLAGTGAFVAGVDFPAWRLDGALQIAIQTGASGAPGLRFDNSVGEGYQFFGGTASGSFTPTNTAGGVVYYTVDVVAEEPRRGGATLESVDFGCLPIDWVNGSSTWSFSPITRAATSGTAGLANHLRSGAVFGLDKRTLRWEFALGDSSSVVGFLTNPQEGGIQAGSLVRVSAADQQIQIYSRYTGANTPTAISGGAVACALTAGTRYVFEWTKNGRTFTASVKALSGETLATITRTATPLGYSTYPSHGYDQGTMQGAPGAAALAGSVVLYGLDHRAACAVGPDLYIIGDSITEGFSVTDAAKYPALVEAALGSTRVAYSGIGGAVTAGALSRIKSEVTSLRPRNVLIYLGTNTDGSFATNIVKIVYACQQLGANVYVATVATNSTSTATVNGLASWVRKVGFDLALTTAGAGTSLVAEKYAGTDAAGNAYDDSLHPNTIGHRAMYDRIALDAPELLIP